MLYSEIIAVCSQIQTKHGRCNVTAQKKSGFVLRCDTERTQLPVKRLNKRWHSEQVKVDCIHKWNNLSGCKGLRHGGIVTSRDSETVIQAWAVERETACWMYWHHDDRLLAECTGIMTADCLLNVLTSRRQTTCRMYWHHEDRIYWHHDDRLLIMGSFVLIYLTSHCLKNTRYQQGRAAMLRAECSTWTHSIVGSPSW